MSLPYVTLPWHGPARVLLDDVQHGGSNIAILGPPGSGKSALARRFVAGELLPTVCCASDGDEGASDLSRSHTMTPDRARVVLLGDTVSPMAMLEAIHNAGGTRLSFRIRRRGLSVALDHVATALAKDGIRVLVLDEIQNATADAIRHALMLRDLCAQHENHTLVLVLLGTPAARAAIQATEQLGQRLPVIQTIGWLTPDELQAVAMTYPPVVAAVRRLGKRDATALWQSIFKKTRGAVRPLAEIIRRAEFMAKTSGGTVMADHLVIAIGQQV